jgi:hypothetical protein
MKKLIFIAGATYFVTRRWDKLPESAKNKVRTNAKNLAYKAGEMVGRGLEELDYRMAWHKLGKQ